MNPGRTSARRPIAVFTCMLGLLAVTSTASARCYFENQVGNYITFEYDLGNAWVARDAPVGTTIATRALRVPNQQGFRPICFYVENPPFTSISVNSSVAPLRGPVTAPGAGDILPTNVAGIGAIFELGLFYDGSSSNSFTPDDGSPYVPYQGTMIEDTAISAPLGVLYGKLTLVKTGPIDPVPKPINQEMFHAILNDLGRIYDFRLKGLVRQAQCTLKSDPVVPGPVQLGTHEVSHFKAIGTVTGAIPFYIRLSDCDDDPADSQATAYIHMTGALGSTIHDADAGVITLDNNAKADGLGIQVNHDDGRPLPLGREVPVTRLAVGETRLNFQARYIQLSSVVTPGRASGALNFTISYK